MTTTLGKIEKPPLRSLAILSPVYNDWDSARSLVEELDLLLAQAREKNEIGEIELHGFFVDDGSHEPERFEIIKSVQLHGGLKSAHSIQLSCNQGHQRAIAIGLAYLANQAQVDGVVVMDADGEDDPKYIVDLIRAAKEHPQTVIVAERAKRSEGPLFKVGYFFYRLLFRFLVGKDIAFGNFMLIPFQLLKRLVFLPSIGTHLAASVFRSRAPIVSLSTIRSTRYFGQSRMNLVSLVIHGLSAISVFSEIALIRTLIALGVFSIGLIACVTFFSSEPGVSFLVVLGIVFQTGLSSILLGFILILQRQLKPWVAAKDFNEWVSSVSRIF